VQVNGELTRPSVSLGLTTVNGVTDTLSAAAARRVFLAAQGFGRPRPERVGTRQLNGLFDRLGLLQLDSVNVFERSHYLPVFARLGAYDKADLDRLTFGKRSAYTEYWAHEAALVPRSAWPLWRWKTEALREKAENDPDSWIHANRDMLDWLRAELAAKGPLPVSQIEHDANKRRGTWWEWSDVKIGMEFLFDWGEVVSSGRTRFERTYALTEQVLPSELLSVSISREDAHRQLLMMAARSTGVGTVSDLADYYRLKKIPSKRILDELVEEGQLTKVRVTGWERAGRPLAGYLHPEARIPRRMDTAALLSPFDPVVWERDRGERMFGFHYRIEIYTPEHKRIFGYYTLPVLVDDAIVARIDLKSDRQHGVLRVQSAWNESGAATGHEGRIAQLIRDAADWQGLGGIEVIDRGSLAPAVAAELGVALLPRPLPSGPTGESPA